jgi:hypothetical protein
MSKVYVEGEARRFERVNSPKLCELKTVLIRMAPYKGHLQVKDGYI